MQLERLVETSQSRLALLSTHHLKRLDDTDRAILLATYVGLSLEERSNYVYLSKDRARHRLKSLVDLVAVPLGFASQISLASTWVGLHIECCVAKEPNT